MPEVGDPHEWRRRRVKRATKGNEFTIVNDPSVKKKKTYCLPWNCEMKNAGGEDWAKFEVGELAAQRRHFKTVD